MTEKQIYEYIVEHCPYCALCGSTQNLHIHHILYRSEGGPTSLWNLIRLCEKCHTKISFYKKICEKPKKLKKSNKKFYNMQILC